MIIILTPDIKLSAQTHLPKTILWVSVMAMSVAAVGAYPLEVQLHSRQKTGLTKGGGRGGPSPLGPLSVMTEDSVTTAPE